MSALEHEDWKDQAACLGSDPRLFFIDRGDLKRQQSLRKARTVCAGCAVRLRCLDYALRHGIKHGIWGGLSEVERRPYYRRMAS